MSAAPDAWNDPGTLPDKAGWYRVKRVDDPDVRFRPFGNGHWWTPLPDGWLGRVEPRGLYHWQDGPICPMEPSSSALTPIQEMERARQRWEQQHG